MKWAQLPGTTLPVGEIHTNFSNLAVLGLDEWYNRRTDLWKCKLQSALKRLLLGLVNTTEDREWNPALLSALWKGKWKQDCPFSNLSSHLALQVSEKHAGTQGCRLSPDRIWFYMRKKEPTLKPTAKANFQTLHDGKIPLNYWPQIS